MAKKLLCVLLSVMMVVAMMPITTSAATIGYIYVNGVDITTATNYTVQCGSGTAVYDPSTYTITLTDATIDTAWSSNYIYVYCSSAANAPSEGVTINLVGDNYIVGSNSYTYGLRSMYCPITITSSTNGSLTISDMTGVAIWTPSTNTGNQLSITNCVLSITGMSSSGTCLSTGCPVYITNSCVTMNNSYDKARGIQASGSGTIYITDSDVTIDMPRYSIYNSNSSNSVSTSKLYVESSQLICTCADTTCAAIWLCGLTVSGNSTVIADGGLDLQIGTSATYSNYAHIVMSTTPAYFSYGLDASSYTTASNTAARSYTKTTAATTYRYTNYPYIMIVTGTGDGGYTPLAEAEEGISSGFRMIYVNEEYHAMIIDRVVNGGNHRFFISMPHVDDNGDGYCDVCKEYVGESEAEIITIDGIDYEVTYAKSTDIVAGNWNQVTLDSDTSLMDALAEDGAILMITRSKETSVSYDDGEYEKFLFIDSWWSNNNTLITLGSAGHTSADESDVIDCLSDDGTTLTYDGATIYAAWVDGGYADGGESLVFISNTSASYTITSFKVLVPVA
ncbi:MAG: hypothetical protein LUH18_02430 [Oscillospiraceae bacterium]|nr:hypothetical protein [Oscillospiraceae bacterium]